ncbi:hypothetical protein PR048_006234 [Dryococelus australis]|uniref:DDE-1 domain-containing protein n=1 Tax=Dryococelus australis TaxID=614101 RepID=A0ABQ9IBJ1_9NEOP|nr:hypothetical protein PR048_006234 [Dryococelus australis]
MQEMGFGLTVNQIRHLAYKSAEQSGSQHPFNKTKGMAGWFWWVNFKSRYGVTPRQPENLALYRASTPNREILNYFYTKLENLAESLQVTHWPGRVWNVDETGLTYVMKPNKVVTVVGKKYVYTHTYAERGITTPVLGCVSASGLSVPPIIIFKAVRMVDGLVENLIPGGLVSLPKNGWINTDLFLEWFSHFLVNIPPQIPVILLMDSHASHLSPQILELAAKNVVHIGTFSSHTTHLLQPLDVGLYKPLRSYWKKELDALMHSHPGENQADQAIAPSLVTERPQAHQKSINDGNTTHKPSFQLPQTNQERVTPKRDPKAKMISPTSQTGPSSAQDATSYNPTPDVTISHQKILPLKQTRPSKSKQINIRKGKYKEYWFCGSCGRGYNENVVEKNGAEWAQCSFCSVWYHCAYQNVTSDVVFMCDGFPSDTDRKRPGRGVWGGICLLPVLPFSCVRFRRANVADAIPGTTCRRRRKEKTNREYLPLLLRGTKQDWKIQLLRLPHVLRVVTQQGQEYLHVQSTQTLCLFTVTEMGVVQQLSIRAGGLKDVGQSYGQRALQTSPCCDFYFRGCLKSRVYNGR